MPGMIVLASAHHAAARPVAWPTARGGPAGRGLRHRRCYRRVMHRLRQTRPAAAARVIFGTAHARSSMSARAVSAACPRRRRRAGAAARHQALDNLQEDVVPQNERAGRLMAWAAGTADNSDSNSSHSVTWFP